MRPTTFPGCHRVYAENQPEYIPLPAHVDEGGVATTCWKFTFFERLTILVRGRMWFQQMTFNDPLQPQRPSVAKPDIGPS